MANAMLPKYVPCTKQPQGLAEIDWGNPLTRGMLSSIVTSLQYDPVSSSNLSALGNPSVSISGIGTGSATAAQYSLQTRGPIGSNKIFDGLTLVAVIDGLDNSSNPTSAVHTFVGADTPEYGTSIVQQQYAINGIRAGAYYHPNYNGRLNISVAGAILPGRNVVVFRYRRNALCELFVNGVVVGSAMSADMPVKFDAPGGVNKNTIIKIAGVSVAGSGIANCIVGRAYSDEEVVSISKNPWQLFHQRVQSPQNVTTKENRRPIIRESNMLGTSKRKLSDVNLLPVVSRKKTPELGHTYSIDTLSIPNGANLVNIVGRNNWVINNSNAISKSNSPVGESVLNSSNGYFSRSNFQTSGPMTVVVVYTPTSITGTHGIWSLGTSSADAQPGVVLQRDGANVRVFIGGYRCTFTGIASIGRTLNIVISLSDVSRAVGSLVSLAINGVVLTGTVTATQGDIVNEFFISGYNGQAVGHYSLYARLGLYSANVARDLSSNPWQLFRQSSNLPLLK